MKNLYLHTLLRNSPIQRNATLALMLAAATIVILSTIAFTLMGMHNIRSDLQSELQLTGNLIGSRNAAALQFNNKEFAAESLKILSEKPDILLACLYDTAGKVFSVYGSKDAAVSTCAPIIKSWNGKFEESALWSDKQLTITSNIFSDGDIAGAISLTTQLDKIDAYLQRQVMTGLAVIMIMLVIAYLLSQWLQRLISKPILEVIQTTQQLVKTPGYSARAPRLYQNELGGLIDAFNYILSEREKTHLAQHEQYLSVLEGYLAFNGFVKFASSSLREPFQALNVVTRLIDQQLLGQKVENYTHYFNDLGEAMEVHRLNMDAVTELSRLYEQSLAETRQEVLLSEALKGVVMRCKESHPFLQVNFAPGSEKTQIRAYQQLLEKTFTISVELMARVIESTHFTSNLEVEVVDNESLHVVFRIHLQKQEQVLNPQSLDELISSIKQGEVRPVDQEMQIPAFFSDTFRKDDFDFIIHCIKYVATANGITVEYLLDNDECILFLRIDPKMQVSKTGIVAVENGIEVQTCLSSTLH